MVEAFADITTAVGNIVTMATTGEVAIYFYGGVATLAIGLFSRLKRK